MLTSLAVAALLPALLAGGAAADESWGREAGLWRNIIGNAAEYDAELAAIDAMVDPDRMPAHARHVRALISRFDAVDHYRAPDNLALIVRAIGTGTYPGYPAVDVLAHCCEIEESRRRWFLGWSRALAAWAQDEPATGALELEGEAVSLEDLLGERTARQGMAGDQHGQDAGALHAHPGGPGGRDGSGDLRAGRVLGRTIRCAPSRDGAQRIVRLAAQNLPEVLQRGQRGREVLQSAWSPPGLELTSIT